MFYYQLVSEFTSIHLSLDGTKISLGLANMKSEGFYICLGSKFMMLMKFRVKIHDVDEGGFNWKISFEYVDWFHSYCN